MKAEEMFEKIGYIKDEESRFGSEISYVKYCKDGCCRENDLAFYKNGFEIDEIFITYELLQAINQQCKELGIFE